MCTPSDRSRHGPRPAGRVLVPGREVEVSMVADADGLAVTLRLAGQAMIDAYAGEVGRLVSDDGRIAVAFRFDLGGTAVCLLTEAHIAQAGLIPFHVEVDGDGGRALPTDEHIDDHG